MQTLFQCAGAQQAFGRVRSNVRYVCKLGWLHGQASQACFSNR